MKKVAFFDERANETVGRLLRVYAGASSRFKPIPIFGSVGSELQLCNFRYKTVSIYYA